MRTTRLPVALLIAGLLPACATLPPGERDPRDRFERVNRGVYRFNDALDRGIARPAAKAYVKVTPRPVRTGFGNFWRNLTYPTVMINNLLQGKPGGFLTSTARLLVNTTIGIGGLFDPASQLGIPASDEDFGQTLGRWGVPPGPYMVLPVLGPSTVRDSAGLLADQFSDPKYYLVKDFWLKAGLTAAELLDRRAGLLGTDDLLTDSFDPYAFMRNAYLQRREFQVRDGDVPPGEDFEIFEDEESTGSADQAGEPADIDVPAGQDDADPPAPQALTD